MIAADWSDGSSLISLVLSNDTTGLSNEWYFIHRF